MAVLVLASCNDVDVVGDATESSHTNNETQETTTPVYEYTEYQNDEAHYLVFLNNKGKEITRIVVLPSDTYDSLKSFFPNIPIGEGTRWESAPYVYDENNRILNIRAID